MNKRRGLILLLILSSAIIVAAIYPGVEDRPVELNSDFVWHVVEPTGHKLHMYWRGKDQKPLKTFANLKVHLSERNQKLVFAMNAGMFLQDYSPQGLFIQNGQEVKKMNITNKAYGNFYMQPNGVFYINQNGEAHVKERNQFKLNDEVKYATQSGPMLLIDGAFHPTFNKNSKNVHIRNGVGILPNGNVIMAMSRREVTFYELANFFKQRGCENALYLDGFVSRIYHPSQGYNQDGNFGVMIGEVAEHQCP